jgi:serine/threonine protein kinase
MTEVEALTHLHHPNIVNMVEFSNEGVVQKSNGKQYPVIYIVLELATGGEFFDYIATGGMFPERISRFYFRQLIEALDYVHTRGAAHRDLKPENLLFDKDYNLKVADFGFAAPIEGRDGSGHLKTKLGTESYMAPEINLKKPYSGASVDLFASAIILFIMTTQHPPFTKAIPDDPYYKLICINRLDIFWKAHARNKPGGEAFFS